MKYKHPHPNIFMIAVFWVHLNLRNQLSSNLSKFNQLFDQIDVCIFFACIIGQTDVNWIIQALVVALLWLYFFQRCNGFYFPDTKGNNDMNTSNHNYFSTWRHKQVGNNCASCFDSVLKGLPWWDSLHYTIWCFASDTIRISPDKIHFVTKIGNLNFEKNYHIYWLSSLDKEIKLEILRTRFTQFLIFNWTSYFFKESCFSPLMRNGTDHFGTLCIKGLKVLDN